MGWIDLGGSRGPAPKKKTTKKKRPAAKKKVAKKAPGTAAALAGQPSGKGCARSPCGGLAKDPQLSKTDVVAAMAYVGSHRGHKKKVTWSRQGAYLTVAFGGGVDSSAILVGLDQLWKKTRDKRWVPLAVTFADTGGEHPHTYEWIRMVDRWLREHAFKGAPASVRPIGVTKVAYAVQQRAKGSAKPGWGTAQTLEQHALVNHSLPSISFGGHSCSTKWKIAAQKEWFWRGLESGELPWPEQSGKGKRILRAIGYDATETSRRDKHSTYSSKDEGKSERGRPPLFQAWHPLIDWGWDRARCAAETKVALGVSPRKSSCTFCGAMRPLEVRILAEDSPDLLARAVFMELVAIHGRHGPMRPRQGLNQSMPWSEAVLGKADHSPLWTAHLIGGVVRTSPSKQTAPRGLLGSIGVPGPDGFGGTRYVAYVPPGGSSPVALKKNEHYVSPAEIPGVPVGQLMRREDVAELRKLAKEWVRAAPDRGKKVRGWARGEGGGKRTSPGKRPAGDGWRRDEVVDDTKKGDPKRDVALLPITTSLPAFADVHGFRTSGELAYDVLPDKLMVQAAAAGDRVTLKKLQQLLTRIRRRPMRNPGRALPIAPGHAGGVVRDPTVAGF